MAVVVYSTFVYGGRVVFSTYFVVQYLVPFLGLQSSRG